MAMATSAQAARMAPTGVPPGRARSAVRAGGGGTRAIAEALT